MAVDEALLISAEKDPEATPTLRLYGWSEPTISVGYLQDMEKFQVFELPIVRRISGGRALLHDMEITYSVIANRGSSIFSGGISGAYDAISGCIVEALEEAGVGADFSRGRSGTMELRRDACFGAATRFEVLAEGKKIVASAQRRFKRAFLQHGSIMLDIDRELNEKVFGLSVVERMAWVWAYTDIGAKELGEILVRRFSSGLGVDFFLGGLSRDEKDIKAGLIEEKYGTGAWGLDRAEERVGV